MPTLEKIHQLADDYIMASVRGTVLPRRDDTVRRQWQQIQPAPTFLFGTGFMIEVKFESRVKTDEELKIDPCLGAHLGMAVGRLHIGHVMIPAEIRSQGRSLYFDPGSGLFRDKEFHTRIERASGLFLFDNNHAAYVP